MNLRRAVLLVIVITAAAVGYLLLPLREWSAQFEAYVRSLGAFGPLLFAFAYMLLTVVLFPASILTVAAGTIFGLKMGFFTALLGANLGALCSFLLARSFLRQRVVLWTAAHPKFRFLDAAIANQGFKIVLLCRLSPIFPFILLNYFLGLTSVRTGAYVLGNLLGMIPANFVFVYIGATAHDAVAGPAETFDFYQQAMKYVGLLATVIVFTVITRMARRALREAERAREGGGFVGQPDIDTQSTGSSGGMPARGEGGCE
ncbi:MAG TPA: TVP38/TMEM64 family protein [Pyrinomonadaceae bacterium]|nr:TVP38/TMEM64 family protein [Pyrinomonadaceae bacterium]